MILRGAAGSNPARVITVSGFSILEFITISKQQKVGQLRPFVVVTEDMGYRPDKEKGHRSQYEKNKKRIYATQTTCGICGRPVDFSLKYPHPLSPTIDHIIPVSKGGHPSDIDNLQLAHRCCNRQKSDKLVERKTESKKATLSPRVLPQTFEWTSRPLRAVGSVKE